MSFDKKVYTIKNDVVSASFLSRGATLVSFQYHDGHNIVVSYKDYNDYDLNPAFLGTNVGPLAGRIKEGRLKGYDTQLSLNSRSNHLHGGFAGIHTRDFEVLNYDNESITFGLIADHRSDGYPGYIDYKITYSLKDNSLELDIVAIPDEPFPLSLTNHSYFNLEESNTLDTHEMKIESRKIALNDETKANDGSLLDIEGTVFDFNMYRAFDFTLKHSQFETTRFIDHDYFLDGNTYLKTSEYELIIKTDTPIMRVYTANFFEEGFIASHGEKAKNFSAVAFEPQYLANGYNLGYDKPSDKEHPFHSHTIYTLNRFNGV